MAAMEISPLTRGMFWVVTQFILLLTWFVLLVLGTRYYHPDGLRHVIDGAGMVLLACGLFSVGRGVYDLGRNLTPMPEPRGHGAIVRKGIYRHVRHPMYGGMILAIIGASLLYLTPLTIPLVLLIIGFFYAKSSHEEHRLIDRYPEYAEHRRQTKRFIPYIW